MSPRQLPLLSGKRIVRALEKVGFEVVGTRGSHCKLRHLSPPRVVIVPLHDEVRPGTLASILRQGGMTVDELRSALKQRGGRIRRQPLRNCRINLEKIIKSGARGAAGPARASASGLGARPPRAAAMDASWPAIT